MNWDVVSKQCIQEKELDDEDEYGKNDYYIYSISDTNITVDEYQKGFRKKININFFSNIKKPIKISKDNKCYKITCEEDDDSLTIPVDNEKEQLEYNGFLDDKDINYLLRDERIKTFILEEELLRIMLVIKTIRKEDNTSLDPEIYENKSFKEIENYICSTSDHYPLMNKTLSLINKNKY